MARVKIELPETYAFSVTLPVRITDINYGQHLGNDALFAFLHEARAGMLAAHGLSEQDVGGCGIIMTDAAVTFKAEALYGDQLVVDVAIGNVTRMGCDFVYRVRKDASDEEVARAKTGIVCFDYTTKKMTAMPDAFRSLITDQTIDAS